MAKSKISTKPDKGTKSAAVESAPQKTTSKPPLLSAPVRLSLRKFALERPADEQDRDRSIVAADETRNSQTLVSARTGRRFGPARPIRVRIV